MADLRAHPGWPDHASPAPADPRPPVRQRADARIGLGVERMGAARSGLRRVAESGSARVRLPTTRDGVPEAVLINTGGGIASGDRFTVEGTLGPAAELVATTAAAEKIYRSDGDTAFVSTRFGLDTGSRLAWLPQETILYDRARLRRCLDVDMAEGASALLFEATVFGRAAFGETCRAGFYEDRWRIRRGGRLVYADTLRFEGDIAARLARPAVAGGGRALATLLWVAPEAEAALDRAREALDGGRSECGASAYRGMLVARFVGPDAETLRRDAARLITCLRGTPMPRVWNL